MRGLRGGWKEIKKMQVGDEGGSNRELAETS